MPKKRAGGGGYALSLRDFALKCLQAKKHPKDRHIFARFRCDVCGEVPMELRIDHYTGSSDGNFKGKIMGVCAECRREKEFFSFAGEERKLESKDVPTCECGNNEFVAGICERYEGDDGFSGFFDEGVIVGQCSKCGLQEAFAYTD